MYTEKTEGGRGLVAAGRGREGVGFVMTKKNLDVYIFEQLRDRMLAGTWQPGDRLDVDRLADQYQVSRTPVLQALRRMEGEGMIRVTRGGKFYLPAFSVQEVEDICGVLAVLEGEAVRLLAEERGSAEALGHLAEELCQAARAGDHAACCRLEAEWHRRLVGAAGNSCLEECFAKALGQYLAAWAAAACGRTCLALADRLLELTRALEQQDYAAAAAGLEHYLRCACQHLEGSQS